MLRRFVAMLSVLWVLSSIASALATPDPSGALPPPFPIWPIPRESKIEQMRLLLTHAVIVVPDGDTRTQAPGRLLAELIEDQFMVVIPVMVGKAPEDKTPIIVGEVSSPLVALGCRSDGSGERDYGQAIPVNRRGKAGCR